ncbi:MAG TPA: peptidylprolyl isomerase, partial [Chitinophagaceae bacterium]|nr:peptidylprolyl isomerase [Chitinophagaceae bacterium]
ISTLADGRVMGPYLDGGSYVLAKMIGKRTMPDTSKVRHILISMQNGTPDSIAKRRIDSVEAVTKTDSAWKKVAAAVSDDPGSKDKGGEYEFPSTQTNLAKEFYEVAFYGKTGDRKIIKTDFGYHLIEVLNQKDFQPAYKVAYLSRPILASTLTDNTASGKANQFSGQSRTYKAFQDNAAKEKLSVLSVPEVKPHESAIPGIGANRQFVRWINDADKGEVSDAFRVDDNYVVAVVTDVNEEGVMGVAKARPLVENLIRRHKKAEQIMKKVGNPTDLQAAASAMGGTVAHADSASFMQGAITNVGQEYKVVGAAFNKQWQGKISPAIEGNTGVFVVKPEAISAVPNVTMNIEDVRNNIVAQKKSSAYRATEALKSSAKIKDYRGEF